MTNSELIKSIEIFRLYRSNNMLCIIPEHDVLYANTEAKIHREDIDKLVKIGWWQDDGEFDENGDWIPESYDVDNPWKIFV